MKRWTLVFGLIGCALCLTARTNAALTHGMYLVMPRGTDPGAPLTFTSTTAIYDHTDGEFPGDNQGELMTGGVLEDGGANGGLELHGQVPGEEGFDPVLQLNVTSSIDLTNIPIYSEVATGEFTPWKVVKTSPYTFSVFAQDGSAPLVDATDPGYFGQLYADDLGEAFTNATFTFQGQTFVSVPEPGLTALAVGLLLGGVSLRRRRKRA